MSNHNSSSQDLDETARSIESVLLDGVERVGVDALGMAMGVDRSTISKLKTDEHKVNFGAISKMLALMGLKIVPKESRCFPPGYVENLHFFASIGMRVDPVDAEKIMNPRPTNRVRFSKKRRPPALSETLLPNPQTYC